MVTIIAVAPAPSAFGGGLKIEPLGVFQRRVDRKRQTS
jgi:hypothetical protein